MKPKIRPIKDLYFRFISGGPLENVINCQNLAVLLSAKGMIELEAHTSAPRIEHYRDTAEMKGLEAMDLKRILEIE